MGKAQPRRSKSTKPTTTVRKTSRTTKKPVTKVTQATKPKKPLNTPKPLVTAAASPFVTLAPAPIRQRRRRLKASFAGVALICMLAVAFITTQRRHPTTAASNNQRHSLAPPNIAPQSTNKANLTILEGQAQVSNDNLSWTDLAVAASLKDGQFIRVADKSRIAIGLNDGSVVRAGSNTLLRLVTLSSSQVRVDNLNGQIYSRVATKPERSFVVTVDDQLYTATEAAYMSNKLAGLSGIDNYFGKVQISSTTSAAEGQRYYKTHPNPQLADKLTPLSPEQLASDSFLQWNYDQDKAIDSFKDKLGFLNHLAVPTPAVNVSNVPNAPVAPAKPVTVTPTKMPPAAPAVPPPTGQPDTKPPAEPSGNITLANDKSNDVSWTTSGQAPYGFKLIWSQAPNYDEPSGSAHYAVGITSGSITSAPGNYHVYVCALDGQGFCVIRSNSVHIEL